MAKMYGSYSDADLNLWERLPMNVQVLTSSAFGAWLRRRDERIEESKTGHWMIKSHRSKCGVVFIEFECSCCHKKVYDEYTATYQYCPNCGAKMEAVDD